MAEIALDLLASSQVKETRCIKGTCLAGHRLGAHPHRRNGALFLWGGGWLASDRIESTTLTRWGRHLERVNGPLVGIGLGLGPFDFQRDEARRFLSRFDFLSVRTPQDVARAAELGIEATLGSDVAFLDPNISPSKAPSSDYAVVSFARYGTHWAVQRPWLTEEFYREYVRSAVAAQRSKSRNVVFLEFDNGQGGQSDYDYWRDLNVSVIKPKSVHEAKSIIQAAQSVSVSRLHAGIMAALSGRSVTVLAYHDKFAALEELGLPVDGLNHEPHKVATSVVANSSNTDLVIARGRNSLQRGIDLSVNQ